MILVDVLEEASIRFLQDSTLPHFGYLAALQQGSQLATFSIGLCAVYKQPNGRDVQLKVKHTCCCGFNRVIF